MKRSSDLQARLAAGWISLNQFSIVMGMSYPVALRLAKAGRIKTVRIGSMRRVLTEEVERILKEGTDKVVQTPEAESNATTLLEQSPSIFDDEGVNHD